MIRRLIILLLIVGCEETLEPIEYNGVCVEMHMTPYEWGNNIVTCYPTFPHNVCLDKEATADENYSYDWVMIENTETDKSILCEEYCNQENIWDSGFYECELDTIYYNP